MKIARPLLLIGGALLIFTVMRAAKFYKGLQFSFTNISIGGKFFSPKVFATITVKNPSDVKISLSDIAGKLLYKGKPVADIVMRDVVEVLPQSTVFFDIEAQSILPDVLMFLQELISAKDLSSFSFDGSVKVNSVPVPLKNISLKW